MKAGITKQIKIEAQKSADPSFSLMAQNSSPFLNKQKKRGVIWVWPCNHHGFNKPSTVYGCPVGCGLAPRLNVALQSPRFLISLPRFTAANGGTMMLSGL